MEKGSRISEEMTFVVNRELVYRGERTRYEGDLRD